MATTAIGRGEEEMESGEEKEGRGRWEVQKGGYGSMALSLSNVE